MIVIGIIPARGGSRGIRFKNIVLLGGKPLIAYTILAAKKSHIFDRIIVSTDNEKIKEVAWDYGAEVISRPKKISQDKSPIEPVLLHVLKYVRNKENYKPDIVCLLQPTSPLRDELDIKAAYKKFINDNVDSLLSVVPNKSFIWQKTKDKFKPINYNFLKRPRRQDMKHQFLENGAIYMTRYSTFIKFKNRLGDKIGFYVMDEEKSIDIDNRIDLLLAQQLIKRKKI